MKVWIIPVENQIRTDSSEVDIYLLLGEEGAEGEGGGLARSEKKGKGRRVMGEEGSGGEEEVKVLLEEERSGKI